MYPIFKPSFYKKNILKNYFDESNFFKKYEGNIFISQRKLKTIGIGFENKSKIINNDVTFSNKIKQIIFNFINKSNNSYFKVLDDKNKYYYYYNNDINKKLKNLNIKKSFLKLSINDRENFKECSNIIFEFLIANRNDIGGDNILEFLKIYYKDY